jgi:2-methylcitrate dehydratase PrpD
VNAPQAADGLTRTLVRRALALKRQDLAPEVAELARQCLLDVLGVALAGHDDPLPRLVASDQRAQGGRPEARVLGTGERLTVRQAALVNGCAAHALDFDDVNLFINGHPSAVLAPALLALADARDASGADFFMAFVAGYEFACRAGEVVEPGHYARGYHATSSVGVLGVALGCARLLGLDEARTLDAVGIAATSAAGLKCMFGTPCKPLHAGQAARNGLEAALWAAQGLVSRPDVLECAQGFARTLSPDFHPEAALADPSRFYLRDTLFKYHAACYGTHSAIEAALALRRDHALQPADIERVLIRVERIADTTCNIAAPATPSEARFSLRFATAMALAGVDTGDLAMFSEATLAGPELQRLRAATRVELMEGWTTMESEVEVALRDGRVLRAHCDTGVPCPDVRAQAQRLAGKFRTLTVPLLGESGSAALARAVAEVETQPVRALLQLCEPAGSPR